MIDFTKMLEKLVPEEDGQGVLRLLVGTVSAIASDGTVDVTLNGVTVPDVPVLGGAYFAVSSTVQILSYRGSLLIIGAAGPGAGRAATLAGNVTTGTTSSTSFTNSLTPTGIHGVAFIAPPSGTVFVLGRSTGSNANAGSQVYLDVEVRAGSVVGSGALVYTPSLDTASTLMSAIAGATGTLVSSALISGLTPGSAYNTSLAHAVSGNTGTFIRRYISVLPQ